MRRLIALMMILMMNPVMAEDTASTPTPILTSINDMAIAVMDFRDDIIGIVIPSVRIPNDIPVREIKCLADNIYFESKGEPYEGQLAVAQVTINRVEHPEYPKTVCGVVWQQGRDRRTGKRVAQFSWTLDGKPDVPKSKTAYEEAYAIAEEVLLYGVESAMIGTQVIYYHANYVNPRWRNVQKVARIGNHIFYQPRT